jgi:hypothetical protein
MPHICTHIYTRLPMCAEKSSSNLHILPEGRMQARGRMPIQARDAGER